MRVISLKEEEDLAISRDAIPENLALTLYRLHSEQLEIAFPAPFNEYSYILRSKGYIGQIPISNDLTLSILPKVPLSNIFRMLEYAYNLKSFQFLEGTIDVDCIEDLFERLVSILAKRILDRIRKGLYQGYVRQEERLNCQRGRILMLPTLRAMQKASAQLECEYEEYSPDLTDNQILVWTLHYLPRFGLRREEVRRQVRQAYHALSGTVSLNHFDPCDCIKRFYHRLNDDYKPMHGLCRFFLDHCGPGMEAGEHNFIPFLVHMPRLFEAFVTEWLKLNPPEGTYIRPQYQASLDSTGTFSFRIDFVLYDSATDQVLAVMDTKYKRDERPSEEDIKDIVAYAVRMETKNGFLIYPSTYTESTTLKVGNVRVRTVTFDIASPPEQEGFSFLTKIAEGLH